MKQIFTILSDPAPHFIGAEARLPTSHPFFYKAADINGQNILLLSARNDYTRGLPVQLDTTLYKHMCVIAYHLDQAKPAPEPAPFIKPSRSGWDYQ